MLSLLAFIAGVIMLIKGNFRLLNRLVSKRDGRLAGVILMAPFALELCLVFSLSFSMVSDSMVVGADGSVSISGEMFDAYLDQVSSYSNLFLIALGAAVAATGLIIWRSPQIGMPAAPFTNPPTNGQAGIQPPPEKPKRTHPLAGYGSFAAAPPPPSAAPKSIMTVAEAAAYIGQTSADVERLIDQNRLPASRSTSGYRIARSALDDLLNGEL
ncbi:MAG: helix-turn-helix domain-containing protein [Anaerolineae bacterium]|nr:helix-turn-helix domain-containing protein [Anaerolineae bacterium]